MTKTDFVEIKKRPGKDLSNKVGFAIYSNKLKTTAIVSILVGLDVAKKIGISDGDGISIGLCQKTRSISIAKGCSSSKSYKLNKPGSYLSIISTAIMWTERLNRILSIKTQKAKAHYVPYEIVKNQIIFKIDVE